MEIQHQTINTGVGQVSLGCKPVHTKRPKSERPFVVEKVADQGGFPDSRITHEHQDRRLVILDRRQSRA